MKKLLAKELFFTSMKLTYWFILFGIMTLLPGYPILMGAFFVCLGIFQTFMQAREQNDVLFTALLPVSKADVVSARYLYVCAIEGAAFVLCAVLTVVRMTVLADAEPYVNNALMNANLFYLGFVLLGFALFNVVFVRGFWRSAYALGAPFVRFIVAFFLLTGVAEALHHFPGMALMNTPTGWLGAGAAMLAAGAVVFAVVTVLSCKASQRSFERIDL